jgi:hypothetical protein
MTGGLAVCVLLAVSVVADAKDKKEEERLKAFVTDFLRRVKKADLDGILAMSDVPWLDGKQGIITDRQKLKDLIRERLKAGTDVDGLELGNVLRFSDLRENLRDKIGAKKLEQVVGKNGLIILLLRREPIGMRYLLVRRRGDAPRVVGGPFRYTYILQPNVIPSAAREALEAPEKVELLSLDPDRRHRQKGGGFHAWKVLGRTEVKDKGQQKELTKAFITCVEESDGLGAACFDPRHGIRVTRKGQVVDLVICFECLQADCYSGDKQENSLFITRSAENVFDQVLRKAGVPLAEKGK